MTESTEPQSGSDLSAIAQQAAEALRQAEEANRKANSEAGFAFNAKQMAEQHATAISGLKGQAESDAGWFTAAKQGAEAAQSAISSVKTEAESAQRSITEALQEIERTRAAVKVAGEKAEESRAAVATSASEAATQQKAAGVSAAAASTSKDAAAKSNEVIEGLLATVTEQASKVAEHATKVDELAKQVTKDSESAQALVVAMTASSKKAAEVLAVIEKHEKDLAAQKQQFEATHKRIEGLLPYAASAGLATAFREQKARFFVPQWMWLGTFVATIVGLMTSSLWGLPAGDSWEGMGRHFVNRLPLIAPLVWLAIYAGRHYSLTLRLQEEYAYKEAVSAAFEGYKREMSTVGARPDGGSPLVMLCENVLTTLGQRPGRIYEGKHEDITPMNTALSAAKDAAVAAKEAVQAATAAVKPAGGG